MKTYHTVLTIAGSDSGGGAGIQADLKTFSALGCYGTSAITAITVQNTLGVSGIHHIPANIVQGQISAIIDDIAPHAIKIGMVPSAELAIAIAQVLNRYPHIPVIFDPVMVSSSGHHLVETDTITTLQKTLFPIAHLITPNLDEAELLTGITIGTLGEMKQAATRLLAAGSHAVLVKGGHLTGSDLYDVFADKTGFEKIFRSTAINTNNTHGTGCTLSSAIATYIALGNNTVTAVGLAKTYVHQAIAHGKDVVTGSGHGPLNHFFDPQKLVISEEG